MQIRLSDFDEEDAATVVAELNHKIKETPSQEIQFVSPSKASGIAFDPLILTLIATTGAATITAAGVVLAAIVNATSAVIVEKMKQKAPPAPSVGQKAESLQSPTYVIVIFNGERDSAALSVPVKNGKPELLDALAMSEMESKVGPIMWIEAKHSLDEAQQ